MKVLLQILLLVSLFAVIALQISKGFMPQTRIISVCPVSAISMESGKAVIDPAKCIGCRRCVDGIITPFAKAKVAKAVTVKEISPVTNIVPEPDQTPPQITELPKPVKEVVLAQSPKKAAVLPAKHTSHWVNKDICIGCQLCVANCPTNAITMVDGKAVIDKTKCINCGICINGNGDEFAGCPVKAISPPD